MDRRFLTLALSRCVMELGQVVSRVRRIRFILAIAARGSGVAGPLRKGDIGRGAWLIGKTKGKA